MRAYVVTLVAGEGQPLTEAMVATAARAVRAQDARWLAPGAACDLLFTVDSGTELQSLNPFYLLRRAIAGALDAGGRGWALVPFEAQWRALAGVIGSAPVDFIMQPLEGRRKKLLISDMDSTMITVECIDELADFVGKKAEVAAITERAMNGELPFEAALTERVRLLAGLPEATLAECYATRVRLMPGAGALVAAMRASGAYCLLVSGGFTYFTARVREELGFHEDRANVLEVKNGILTGEVTAPILGKEAKLAALRETCAGLSISPQEALAVGDGANDLPMLLAAGLGVAYRAKPNVQRQCWARLNHSDLSGLVWAMGFTQEEAADKV